MTTKTNASSKTPVVTNIVAAPNPAHKGPIRKVKPPVPKYHYKLVTVEGSMTAGRMERSLRDRLDGRYSVSLFTICHQDGSCDVMGDSGATPLEADILREIRAVASAIHKE